MGEFLLFWALGVHVVDIAWLITAHVVLFVFINMITSGVTSARLAERKRNKLGKFVRMVTMTFHLTSVTLFLVVTITGLVAKLHTPEQFKNFVDDMVDKFYYPKENV